MLEKETLRPQQRAPRYQHIKRMKNAITGKVSWEGSPRKQNKKTKRIRKQKGETEDLRGPASKQREQRK